MKILLTLIIIVTSIKYSKAISSGAYYNFHKNINVQNSSGDLTRIANLLPTTYFAAQEENVNCVGKYKKDIYDGTERSAVKDKTGNIIATVCTRFYRFLCMEGTGILKDRGQGAITVNWAGKFKFEIQKKCTLGHGINPNDCLLSHHTIAADPKAHKVGDIIYIPQANGLILPNGTIHQGYFIVLDTGGSFIDIGSQRVDLFVGLENDYNNIFKTAGFHHRKPLEAYKVNGDTRKAALEHLKSLFGELLSNRHLKK